MAQIAIPEKFTAELQDLALQDERSVESVVDEAINSYLTYRMVELPLTPDHLKQGMAEANRGELVSEQEVEAFFDNWEKEASSK
jgi:predicted transcriptional regulator